MPRLVFLSRPLSMDGALQLPGCRGIRYIDLPVCTFIQGGASHKEIISPEGENGKHENDCPADHLEYLHDLRLVRPLEVPHLRTLEGYLGQLGHRFFRVLLPGPGEPHWLV